MLLSAAGNGAIQSEAAAFECEAREKKEYESFTSLNATWKWKPRAKLGRSDEPAVALTRKALKVSLYGTTQYACANETDCVQAFKSAHPFGSIFLCSFPTFTIMDSSEVSFFPLSKHSHTCRLLWQRLHAASQLR
jgi:hypothetical protein